MDINGVKRIAKMNMLLTFSKIGSLSVLAGDGLDSTQVSQAKMVSTTLESRQNDLNAIMMPHEHDIPDAPIAPTVGTIARS